jgi:hypothetical protein
VGVGEPGHERLALTVDGVHAALERTDLAGPDDVLDPLAFHDDGGAVHGVLAGAVDQEGIGKDGDSSHEASSAARRLAAGGF